MTPLNRSKRTARRSGSGRQSRRDGVSSITPWKPLSTFEHWTVVVIEQAMGDVDTEVRCDSDEVLVEGAMVDRAQREAIRDHRLAHLLEVADDVRRVEEANLAEPADRATVAVRGQHGAAELRLVDPLLDLPHDVSAFDLVVNVNRLTLVVRAAHLPERQEHA
jgi:hypothetical protein